MPWVQVKVGEPLTLFIINPIGLGWGPGALGEGEGGRASHPVPGQAGDLHPLAMLYPPPSRIENNLKLSTKTSGKLKLWK